MILISFKKLNRASVMTTRFKLFIIVAFFFYFL